MKSRIAALILAAGESTRMGAPKALLPAPDGRPFVARLAGTFAEAGIADVIVVSGSRHEEIVAVLAGDPATATARVVRNPDPSRGQLSSLLTGLAAADAIAPAAVLVTLVDVPMVAAATVTAVVDAWRGSDALIVRPAIGEEHGHPVLFDRRLFDALRAAPLDAGAKTVVRAHADRLLDVPVTDRGAIDDVDTPADYARLLGVQS